MAKRYWIRGLWIGALIGLIISIIDLSLGLAELLTFPLYVNFPSQLIISSFGLSELSTRAIFGFIANILTYGLIGSLIGLIFKKKR